MIAKRTLLALGASAVLLAGCATGPYYEDTYAYNDGFYYDRPVTRYYDDRYYYAPSYYPRYYGAPSVSFGLSYGRGWRRH